MNISGGGVGVVWPLLAWLAAGQVSPGLVLHGQGSGTPATTEKRLFSVRSGEAWATVQKRLNELGFRPEKMDRENRTILTKWRDFGTSGAWLPTPMLRPPHVASRIRFLVFVSPFAEPARVSIGSFIEGADDRGTSRAVAYNHPDANRALMSELAKALGDAGLPIPEDRTERRNLVLSLLKGQADDCLRREEVPKGGPITPPRKIPLSEFEVVYPAESLAAKKEGTIRVEFEILEDGTVIGVRLPEGRVDRAFGNSAAGAASLLLFSPAKLSGCTVPAILENGVRYTLQR